MKLYSAWRSSASYRVRIALALKDIAYDYETVNLAKGDQHTDAFATINPQCAIPVLEIDDGRRLTQSLAIIEYLEETRPEPALLPADPVERARVRAAAEVIACDVHPIQNLKVLKHLRSDYDADDAQVAAWARRWISEGLAVLERHAAARASTYLFGEAPGYADLTLVPQLYNARRFGLEVAAFPALAKIDARCQEHPAFKAAHPDVQPDAPPKEEKARSA